MIRYEDFPKTEKEAKIEDVLGKPFPTVIIPGRSYGMRRLPEPSLYVWMKRTGEKVEPRIVTKIYETHFECREITGWEMERLLEVVENASFEIESMEVKPLGQIW